MCSYERWRDLLRRRLEEHADDAATSQVRKVLLDENAELEDLPVREKLHILYWLCMWKMDYTPEIVCYRVPLLDVAVYATQCSCCLCFVIT